MQHNELVAQLNQSDETFGMDEDEFNKFIDDPSLIETHEKALVILDILDSEIANIQVQLDAARIEANGEPLPPERQAWLKRASYAAAMRRNARLRVYQRDKEIRYVKGKAVTDPKDKEVKLVKQQRLRAEVEDRRLKRQQAIEAEKTHQMLIAHGRRFSTIFREEAKRLLPTDTYEQIVAATNQRLEESE